jgi:hypothetical protein
MKTLLLFLFIIGIKANLIQTQCDITEHRIELVDDCPPDTTCGIIHYLTFQTSFNENLYSDEILMGQDMSWEWESDEYPLNGTVVCWLDRDTEEIYLENPDQEKNKDIPLWGAILFIVFAAWWILSVAGCFYLWYTGRFQTIRQYLGQRRMQQENDIAMS